MKRIVVLFILTISVLTLDVLGQFQDPFTVKAEITKTTASTEVVVSFSVPTNHYLYAKELNIVAPDYTLTAINNPVSHLKSDPLTHEKVEIYDDDITFKYIVKEELTNPLKLSVSYQGCNHSVCFMPQTKEFTLGLDSKQGEPDQHSVAPSLNIHKNDWKNCLNNFTVVGKRSGYLKPEQFISFLRGGGGNIGGGIGEAEKNPFQGHGVFMSILIILFLGLALNLTPCVLPMIPINIAIIGGGVESGSRGRGFWLGSMYGLGIAFVYGLLGLFVVLAGARFGALNSMPWFNITIAVLFAVLSMSMFGVFDIDFSRLQGKIGSNKSKGSLIAALFMGGVAALLSGACVAPFVISVLLLSGSLYASGNIIGLFLPFMLGVGMALPWPLAGAGLSFLPKPGKWMERVKYAFGIIILAFAIWYGHLGIKLLKTESQQSFASLLSEAKTKGKPVFIDFWASWCKNCSKMEHSTFQDDNVRKYLNNYTVIKYKAENLRDPEVKAVLDYFGIMGLPTYVILENKGVKQ